VSMSDRVAELQLALRDEKQAIEVEREQYRLLMLEVQAFQAGTGPPPGPVFRRWQACMQARLNLAMACVRLVSP
ncbi:MAG: hypothetical protein JWQ72_1629, partial [Polaromonas sp.]|nr:hypothetical protein [Polaromonas sp.]